MYHIKYKSIIISSLLLLFSVATLQAQVSVGSVVEPESGMLLQIKNKEVTNPSTDNVTVDANGGGLLLSRVQLVNRETLEPFIKLADAEWNTSNREQTKIKHAGLMVYNIAESANFKQGIYVWDGETWTEAGKHNTNYWFYMPPFNLPMDKLEDKTFDLYAEYEKQNGALYARDKLDYAVVHYDSNVLDITGIDNDGVMSYTVKDIDPSATSFMTVIFIVKE